MILEIERFGGRVKDLAGDGVLAFFGAGLILYAAIWVLVPEEGSTRRPLGLDDRSRSLGLLIAGVPLVGALLVWLIGGDDRPDLLEREGSQGERHQGGDGVSRRERPGRRMIRTDLANLAEIGFVGGQQALMRVPVCQQFQDPGLDGVGVDRFLE